MDPKIREMLYRVKESAVDAGKVAGKFAGGVVEQAKINLSIFDLNSEIDVAYKEIGKLVFAVHKGEEISSEAIQSKIEEIDEKKQQVEILRKKLAGVKGTSKSCPVCGRSVADKDVFCATCGYKFENDSSAQADECDASCDCDDKAE